MPFHTTAKPHQKQIDKKKIKNEKSTQKSMNYLANLKLQSAVTVTLYQNSENLKQIENLSILDINISSLSYHIDNLRISSEQ